MGHMTEPMVSSTEGYWLVNQVKGQSHTRLSSLKGKEKDVRRLLEDRELNQARSKPDTVD